MPSWPPRRCLVNDSTDTSLLGRVRERLRRQGIRSQTRASRDWLRSKISNLTRTPDRDRLLREGATVPNALIGSLYFYFYDPLTKDRLPYYDRFPLVFPFSMGSDRFTGLNLHYLDYVNRIRLMDALQQFANNKRYDGSTRLRLSWEVLNDAIRLPQVRPCVHTYLNSHVQSRFLWINPAEWEIALFMPVASFQKASENRVFVESRGHWR